MISKSEILEFLSSCKTELEQKGIKNIALFGSYATGKAKEDSDIDIAYESSDAFISNFKGWDALVYLDENLRQKVAKRFHKNVDLFDLSSTSKIKESIKEELVYV